MSAATTNYGLTKPAENEYYDIEIQNANMDKIDTAMKENADAMLKKDGSVQMTGVLKTVGGADIVNEQLTMHNNGIYSAGNGRLWMTSNIYWSAEDTNWHYREDGDGQILILGDGIEPLWFRYASGAKDAPVTLSKSSTILTNDTGLPLTGGTLSNQLILSYAGASNPNIKIENATLGRITNIFCDSAGKSQMRNTSGANYSMITIDTDASLDTQVILSKSGTGNYKIYGEHNITVSPSAPSVALAEGCQHQVY